MRDNRKDVKVDVLTGREVSKKFWMKKGTWKVNKSKTINIKKKDIIKFEKGNKKK